MNRYNYNNKATPPELPPKATPTYPYIYFPHTKFSNKKGFRVDMREDFTVQ